MCVHVLILSGDYDYDCERVMTNRALQCSLVSDSTACCCEMHVEIVIETWTVGASAEHYDYVSESKSVALCDVLSLENGFLNDCSCAFDWTYGFYHAPSHVLSHVPFLFLVHVLSLFPSLGVSPSLSCDFVSCPFHFWCFSFFFEMVSLHFAWMLSGLE